jgi:hypothetical protein
LASSHIPFLFPMPRRSRRSPRGAGLINQSLNHLASITFNSVSSNYLAGATFGVVANRPARPFSVKVQYVSQSPGRTFTLLFYGANQEVIHRSPILLTGVVPRVYQARLPPNTDFSTFNSADVLMTANSIAVNGNIITLAVDYKMIYKNPLPTSFV